MWKGIKQIVTLKPSKLNIPNKIVKNGTEITNTMDIVNAFNDYFSKIGSNLAKLIEKSDISPLRYLKNPTPHSLFLLPVTSLEIEEEIMNLNTNKATGPYSIPIKLLKLIKAYMSGPLEILYNCSFSSGVDKFKIAQVIPVHKKGPQSVMSNYRPISLLPIFNRLLEKLMYNRLMNFIEKNKILYNKQFGFRSGYSTEHAISLIVDKIQQSIDNRQYSCRIFIHLQNFLCLTPVYLTWPVQGNKMWIIVIALNFFIFESRAVTGSYLPQNFLLGSKITVTKLEQILE